MVFFFLIKNEIRNLEQLNRLYLGTRLWAISLGRYIESHPVGFESQAKKCYLGENWRPVVFGQVNKLDLSFRTSYSAMLHRRIGPGRTGRDLRGHYSSLGWG